MHRPGGGRGEGAGERHPARAAPAGATLPERRQELARLVRADRARLKSVCVAPPPPPGAAAAGGDAMLGVPEWMMTAAPQVGRIS